MAEPTPERPPPTASSPMKTLGVDLASDPARTGVAVVAWTAAGATVEQVDVGADDADVLRLHADCGATGLDSPFGWPQAFVEFVADHATPTGNAPKPWTVEGRRSLRFRETDRVVRHITRRWPLSVSSDLIAVPAFRCIGLLAAMDVTDRSGDGRVYETYPAVALARWGLPDAGYKGRARRDRREALVDQLRARCPWLQMTATADARIREADDALDAVVAALIARAAWLEDHRPEKGAPRVDLPTPTQREAARTEGWIVLPTATSIDRLLG